MDAICTAALDTIRNQEQGYLAVIDGLPDEAINWSPGPDMNSLAVLLTHAWGAAEAWITRATGTEMTRDRGAEFRMALSTADAAARIRQASVRIATLLQSVDPATYGDDRVDPSGEHHTVARCLIHALEHSQEHLGQAGMTRQLWERRET